MTNPPNTTATPVPNEVFELAKRIPLFAPLSELHISTLSDVVSLNNTNYRVEAEGETYLLRIGAESSRLLGIRREEEIEASKATAEAGIAPKVLYADPTGVMVLSFFEGTHWKPEAFHEPANIVRLCETLRRLHAIQTVKAQGSEYRRIERLQESAAMLGLELPSRIDQYNAKLAHIEQERLNDPRYKPGLAHNDFWANNFLDDGTNLCLVDWEFSGTGDTLTDLATTAIAGNYSEAEQVALLTTYGLTEPSDLDTLQKMKWVVAFFEAMWALVMHGIRGSGADTSGAGSDYNYWNYAQKMFERLDVL